MTDYTALINQIESFIPLWVIQLFTIVIFAFLAGYFCRRALKRLEVQLKKTENPWDDAFLNAIRRPLSVLIWVLGLFAAFELLRMRHPDLFINDIIDPGRTAIIIMIMSWFLVRFINMVESNLKGDIFIGSAKKKKKLDNDTLSAIMRLLRLCVIIVSVLVMLQSLGFSISGVLAFGGVGGIAVGFASKDLLANFFGGLMIYLDRPFGVGDWVRSPDKDIEGVVESIGWRLTCIRRFDKRPLYVPNSAFTSIAVENPSRMTHRRIYETIGIRYDDYSAVEAIVSEIDEMIRAHDGVDTNQTIIVNFNAFAASSLDFFVYCYTKTTNWVVYHQVKQDILFKINEIIERHQAQIAFPTSTLHVVGSENNPVLPKDGILSTSDMNPDLPRAASFKAEPKMP